MLSGVVLGLFDVLALSERSHTLLGQTTKNLSNGAKPSQKDKIQHLVTFYLLC